MSPCGLKHITSFCWHPCEEGQMRHGKGTMRVSLDAPQWHLTWRLGAKTHRCCSGWRKTTRSYINRGETIEKPQETAKLLGRHLLDEPGNHLNCFKTMREKNVPFSPDAAVPRQTALCYTVPLKEVYHIDIWLSPLFLTRKRLMLLNAGCLLETQYAQVEAECTGDALQPQPGRGGIINLSLDVWHFLWWSNK